MKKIISLLLVSAFIASVSIPAFAHGHGNGRRHYRNSVTASAGYSVCGIESCDIEGLHYHKNRVYKSHYYGDGHDYHEYCTIEDCVIDEYHEHDGVYCFPDCVNNAYCHHAI